MFAERQTSALKGICGPYFDIKCCLVSHAIAKVATKRRLAAKASVRLGFNMVMGLDVDHGALSVVGVVSDKRQLS